VCPAAYNKSYEDDDDLPLFISGYATLLLTLYKSSIVAEMGDHGYKDMGLKEWGGCCAPFAGELGRRLTQCGLGRDLLPFRLHSFSRLATIDMNRKLEPVLLLGF